MTALSLPLVGAGGEPVDFIATINSHGVATLPPAKPNAELAREVQVTLRLADASVRTVRLTNDSPGIVSITVLGAPISQPAQVVDSVRHILRLDHDLSGFYQQAARDPLLKWVTNGYGRMMRSQTAYEDVIKTILTTNCNWAATVKMASRIVTELGETDPHVSEDAPYGRAFPTPTAMAERDESFYREVIRAGYRAPNLVKLANAVASGELDLESLGTATSEQLSDEDLEKQLRGLPGVGPYAAAHIMLMLGRFSKPILDSWTRPTFARLIGTESVTDAEICERFAPYGEHAGLAFWLTVTQSWFAG
jgi:3-methyladenine DNA glycosylase/8-oxoguanine DNA glycosylase